MNSTIWIFHGSGSQFSSGAFEKIEDAEVFISKYKLTGMLTKYPVGKSAYDWACENGLFQPKKEEHSEASFIQKFSSASQEHYHYENGNKE
ncbi:hypothetical protein BH10BAC2_BH10BAC2_23520 [soil metagenome]